MPLSVNQQAGTVDSPVSVVRAGWEVICWRKLTAISAGSSAAVGDGAAPCTPARCRAQPPAASASTTSSHQPRRARLFQLLGADGSPQHVIGYFLPLGYRRN